MEESEACPRCKTSKYNKPNMRLMINVCAHVLCESCVEQLFFRGTGQCPKCSKLIKKSDFRDLVYEDTYIEKEVSIRKKFIKDLTRSEKEFPTLREFNDYLETVETLIFNLANNIDEEESLKKIEQLKKEAKESAKNIPVFETVKENPLYTYKPYTFYNHGPGMPSLDDIKKNYAPYMRLDPAQVASGFPSYIPVQRILNDSFAELYLSVKSYPQDQ